MPRKENTKAKTWERDRRKRMNAYFKTLADLLPPHQEGRKRNKVDILIHASKYIKDLHSRTEDLFSAHASEAHKEELARLKKLVTQLFSRTQLLSTLLREAGISVPAEPALEKISPLKWSNKINVEDAEKYFSKIEELKNSESKRERAVEHKVPSKRKSTTTCNPSSKKPVVNGDSSKDVNSSIENQENQVNCANSKEDNLDTIGNVSEMESKESENCSTNTSSDVTVNCPIVGKIGNALQKVDSQKKVKRKAKKKDEKKSSAQCVDNSVTNLTQNALILSGGKLMPLVTPMTSNIIVNTQQQSANPIILGNTRQNQMIVMQPLTNRVQNPVVSICNQAVINAVQKVTLNTVPSIRANMIVDSQNWASNVKNIINATKIGGHKGILPKGKEVTKTTMTYKVPIPAVHKEKVEKSKEQSCRKDVEGKSKVGKNNTKTTKNQQSTEISEEKNEKDKGVNSVEEASTTDKATIKRSGNSESGSNDEPLDKKRKTNETIESDTAKVPSTSASKSDFAVTCKSIENLKHVIEKIGEDHNEGTDNDESLTKSKGNDIETNVKCPVLLCPSDVRQGNDTDSSKSTTILTSSCIQDETKEIQNQSSPTTLSNKHLKPSNEKVSSGTHFNISQNISLGKSTDIAQSFNSKSPLAEAESAVSDSVELKKMKDVCNLRSEFENLLQVTQKEPEIIDGTTNLDSNKIILNLDTNTTTTLKPETNNVAQTSDIPTSSPLLAVNIVEDESKLPKTTKDEVSKASLSYNADNSFIPINNRADGLHSDLSNDIFASLQVPSSSNNPESISPTAAFLMAFPLVSSLNGKTEVLEEEMKEDFKYHSQTPPMLLQIGTMEPNSFKLKTTTPPHSIAEKRLKVTCEQKKNISPSGSEVVNPDMLVSVECSTTTKALPKVVNDESLREPYKIIQGVLTTSLEKSATSTSFSHVTLYPTACATSTSSITSTSETIENCQNQIMPNLRNVITNANSENVSSRQINCASTSNKSDQNICTVQVSSTCNTNTRYSTSQDFLSSYSTIVENNLSSLQQNSTTCTNPAVQETNSVGLNQNVVPDVSRPPLISHLTNTSTTTNSSSMTLQSMEMDYTSQIKDKEPHSSRICYGIHGKNTLVDPNVVSNNPMNYAGHIDRGHSTSTQNIQQEYSVQSKDGTLPVLSSRTMQTVYETQPKDSNVLSTQQRDHQSYTVHKKDHIIQNAHNDYTLDQNKNLSRKDSYTTGNGNTAASNRNQSYPSKDQIPNSSESHFQRNYSKMNKESDSSDNAVVDQDTKLNDVLRSKVQEQQQNHRRDTQYNSPKKVDVDPFGQTFSYGVKVSMNSQGEQNILNQSNDNIFPGKRVGLQNYANYSNKDAKKINTSSSNNINSKSLIQNTPVTRYSQQPTSFVATSNYEQSTITENHGKSTTTVAHNSSNFSILSWTTFSPVGGGSSNNLVQFEQGSTQTDNTEAKTICENYNYVPLHKENPNYSNVLTNDVYSVNSTMANIEKSRMKSSMEQQKQTFVDPSKTRNVQTNVAPSGKQNRMQNQSQTPANNNDYSKYNTENKNKTKYAMESEYIQNQYSGMEQQSQQQQHGPKNHQPMAGKQEKAVYPMPSYDSHVNFDLPEVSTQMKYSVESYTSTNFKYPDKSQQQGQSKYQPLVQGQIPSLQHDSVTYNNDGKHGQQQNATKSKANQQQHAIRAPVNWMMTPEIKHNSNIADIILPPIGKELEFCQNNPFAQTPSYNQGTPNQFHNNYDVAAHSFPNLPVLQNEPKRSSDVFFSEEQPFPWSPTKTSVHVEAQSVKGMDQHIVPSSLPTLVGDLDLGTNIPEKQNFLFGQVPARVQSDQSKDPTKDKEGNVAGRDFHNVLNNQTIQHSAAGSSFLSVSQLVEHEKAEKSHQQHHQQHHHHHHHHHAHQHQQQQQQQQQQARKHQRKNNTSPRGNNKRQMDIRKQNSGNDQLHQRHEEQKSSGQTFSDQSYQQQQQQQQQQQKYQQNNIHWRSRNCKSNYTAEALIGTNNSVHDANQDKHASIKFSATYSQNKFQSSLPTADTVMPLNYFPNTDDGSGYGQMVNQNFNSYTYSSNTNIYPTSNFITSISNTPTSYMMPLHDNTDYMEANTFLLPNVAASSTTTSSTSSTVTTSTSNVNTNSKNHQHYGKHQNCDKRSYPSNAKKGKRKALDGTMQNLDFPLSGISSPLEDYHHSATFLPPPPPPHASPLYQNHSQTNVYSKAVNGLPPPPSVSGPQGVPSVATASFPMNPNMSRGGIVASNSMTMSHHPSGTSLTNFNLSTIFPEMNDKITGYKPSNGIPPGLSQLPNQSTGYTQRTNYPANPLCHLTQVSEGSQFGNSVPLPPPPPPPGVIHYKNV